MGALAREIKAEDTGVLVSASSGLPMATASRVSHRSFSEMQSLPDEALRNIRHCTFVHRGAFHQLQVASLARKEEGEVHIVAPDRSELRITGWLNAPNTSSRMTFSQPFHEEEEIDIDAPGAVGLKGCSFSNLAGAPSRAAPPR